MEKKEDNLHEEGHGHRIISPNMLLNNNKNEIQQLLLIISKKYKVSIPDAALALSKTLEKIT